MNVRDKIRYPEELDDLQKMITIPLSYSSLNSYEMCKARYFYDKIIKLPQEFGPPAVMGNIIHAVVEDHLGEDLVLDEMINSFEGHLKELDPDDLIPQKLRDVGENLVVEFYDRHAGEKFEIIGKELPFQVVIGTAVLRGFIDIVLKEKDIIKIIDIKTGSWEVSAKDVPTNLQLGIYALAMAKLFPDVKIYAELYYLRSQRRKGHLFTEADLEQIYETVLQRINELIETNNFRPTDNVRICYFCDYAKPDICKIGAYRLKKKRR